MRTRRGNSYPVVGAPTTNSRKKAKLSSASSDLIDKLPDDVVLSILTKVVSNADCPADFIAALSTCKRLNCLGVNPLVLTKASPETFAVKAKNWSPGANRFLQRCSDAGNIEASYTLGMIHFYCFQNRKNGATLMAKAAIKSHAPALYSLAIIHFNGSGGSKHMKDLIAGVTLCARAAFLGHIDALRELGHCLKDGYGICQDIREGHRLLIEANSRELAAIFPDTSSVLTSGNPDHRLHPAVPGASLRVTGCCHVPGNPEQRLHPAVRGASLMVIGCQRPIEFGRIIPPPKLHPSNRFLVGWFANRVPDPTLHICSYAGCGRPESKMNEFRRCSVCGVMNYCSRGCQARDWTMGHYKNCKSVLRFLNLNAVGR